MSEKTHHRGRTLWIPPCSQTHLTTNTHAQTQTDTHTHTYTYTHIHVHVHHTWTRTHVDEVYIHTYKGRNNIYWSHVNVYDCCDNYYSISLSLRVLERGGVITRIEGGTLKWRWWSSLIHVVIAANIVLSWRFRCVLLKPKHYHLGSSLEATQNWVG